MRYARVVLSISDLKYLLESTPGTCLYKNSIDHPNPDCRGTHEIVVKIMDDEKYYATDRITVEQIVQSFGEKA